MDCHVFRRLCDELVPALLGGRVEKVHQPGDALMFTIHCQGRKRFLFLRHGRKAPCLFLSGSRLPAGTTPPAFVMRLRKYLADRRLVEARVQWPERRLHLRADTRGEVSGEVWLTLDLREGASLRLENVKKNEADAAGTPLPPVADPDRTESGRTDSDSPVLWPDPSEWEKACAQEGWRSWPVLTPALRRTLPLLDKAEQAALLLDLEQGGGDLFLYEGERPEQTVLSAWPLPPALRKDRREEIFESALAAAARIGETVTLAELAERNRADAARPHLARAARLKKLLAKLEGEKIRLNGMCGLRETALALQAELYRFAPSEKRDAAMLRGGTLGVALDPSLTVRENMAAMFHKAARGQRGLALLDGRVASVRAELDEAERSGHWAGALETRIAGRTRPHQKQQAAGKTAAHGLPKGVQGFRSGDGFALLRGRDAAGNALLLKLAAPHDLWLHVAGGAGAHVLIRRDHSGQTVPRNTLEEAGILAALKSELRGEARVALMLAQAKFVHPVKGGRPGQVRVDRQEPGFEVTPDPGLEERLVV